MKINVLKYLLLFILISLQPFNLFSQTNAITEKGDQVILYNDGTWKYVDNINEIRKEIPLNDKIYKKSDNSTFLIKSNKTNTGFYINPKKWTFKKATEVEDAEYELQLKNGDLYCVIITEKIEVPLESLRKIALENARKIAPDMEVIAEEYRMVNNLKVLMLQMSGSTDGVKFTYYGYYYSNEKGTTQCVTLTSNNLFYYNDYSRLI